MTISNYPPAPAASNSTDWGTNPKTQNRTLNKIVVPDNGGYVLLDVHLIKYLSANGSYTIIHLVDKREILVSKTLKTFEMILPKEYFVRVHRSNIINVMYLQKYSQQDGGFVVMVGDNRLELARKRITHVMEKLSQLGYWIG